MAKPEDTWWVSTSDLEVAVLIGKRDARGSLEIAGRGLAANRGTRRGNIVNSRPPSRRSRAPAKRPR